MSLKEKLMCRNEGMYVQVLVVFIYFILLYIIFQQVSKNLKVLREQLQHIQDEGVEIMQSAVHTKYSMFKYAYFLFSLSGKIKKRCHFKMLLLISLSSVFFGPSQLKLHFFLSVAFSMLPWVCNYSRRIYDMVFHQ